MSGPRPRSVGLWGAGFAASVAVHIAAGLALPYILQPDPVAAQPRPKSDLRIETQQVASSQSTEVPPDAPAAATEAATGVTVASGAIPQSDARPVAPATTLMAALPPGTQVQPAMTPDPSPTPPTEPGATILAATSPDAPPLAPAPPQPAQPLAASDPQPSALAAALPQAESLPDTLPQTEPLAAAPPLLSQSLAPFNPDPAALAAAPPQAMVLPASLPRPATAATLTPASVPVAPRPDSGTPRQPIPPPAQAAAALAPQADALPAAAPDAAHFTAALAWSGGAGAQIDAQSLQAIVSFMQPGDVGSQSAQMRDELTAILTGVPCSRLQAEFNPATGSLDLRGHVPDEALRAPVLAALQAQMGSGIKVADAMLILPRPQCGALSGIAAVGLPQSTDQLTNPRLIGADAQARAYSYTKGQQMVLDLAAPDYPAFVYVDFFDAAGQVIHLVPNETVPLRLRAAKSAMRVGAADAGEPFLNITIGPPYGQEIAAAFAASAPLYDGLRPLTEPAEPYLAWLAGQVAAARAADPGFKGEWVYFFVATKEQ